MDVLQYIGKMNRSGGKRDEKRGTANGAGYDR
ncbi:hypothetical protein ABH897_002757 [Paenibacillus sp. RC73]